MKSQIQIVNESTVVTNEQLKPIIAAIQIQVSRDFAPLWGADADLELVEKSALDPAKQWMVVADNSPQAGALGYHDLTPRGLPIGYVFAKDDAKYGESLSVTMSHETIELLGDPDINSLEMNSAGTLIVCKEACDAVEDDQFAYDINSVKVSDFQTLAWFSDAPHDKDTLYDFRGHCSKPFQLLSGGYIGALDLRNPSQGFIDLTADRRSLDTLAKKGDRSRRERRKRLRESGALVRSAVHIN